MKINVQFKALVLATQVNESKDGRKFYNASIFLPENNGEVGVVPVSEDAYHNIVPSMDTPVLLSAEYNDKYNSFRVVGVSHE